MHISRSSSVKFLIVVIILLFTASCASQIVSRPIDPYIDSGFKTYNLQTVAVLPFVIPNYLSYSEGGFRVSSDMTNDMVEGIAKLKTHLLVDPTEITEAIRASYGNMAYWIFEGTREDALTVGRTLGCDGVIFSRVTQYRQGNLTDSEVELEVTLVDVFSATTIWSVREDVLGKQGKRHLNQDVRTPAAKVLAAVAVENALDKIEKINRNGEDFHISRTTPRRIFGYSLLGAGMVSGTLTGYYYVEANKAYEEYRNADTQQEIRRMQTKVEDYDELTWIFGGVALGCLGTSTYLLLTDQDHIGFLDTVLGGVGPFRIAPAYIEDGAMLVMEFRF